MVVGTIQPVFIGGPLHNQAVPATVQDLGQDYVAVDWADLGQVPLDEGITLTQVRYSPHKAALGYQYEDQRNMTVRNVLQVRMWVDSRLCETGRNRLLWDAFRANRWMGVLLGLQAFTEGVPADGQPEEPAP